MLKKLRMIKFWFVNANKALFTPSFFYLPHRHLASYPGPMECQRNMLRVDNDTRNVATSFQFHNTSPSKTPSAWKKPPRARAIVTKLAHRSSNFHSFASPEGGWVGWFGHPLRDGIAIKNDEIASTHSVWCWSTELNYASPPKSDKALVWENILSRILHIVALFFCQKYIFFGAAGSRENGKARIAYENSFQRKNIAYMNYFCGIQWLKHVQW